MGYHIPLTGRYRRSDAQARPSLFWSTKNPYALPGGLCKKISWPSKTVSKNRKILIMKVRPSLLGPLASKQFRSLFFEFVREFSAYCLLPCENLQRASWTLLTLCTLFLYQVNMKRISSLDTISCGVSWAIKSMFWFVTKCTNMPDSQKEEKKINTSFCEITFHLLVLLRLKNYDSFKFS